MSWEAFRLTSKSPSELMHTLGPHGVDELLRQMLAACWRDSNPEGRTYKTVQNFARQVFERNLRVWNSIRKPSPAAFFENLLPYPADGFARQAFVLCWMMLPRTGGRDFKSTHAILKAMFDRNMAAWEQDNETFTGTGKKKPAARRAKAAAKKKVAKKTGKKAKKR